MTRVFFEISLKTDASSWGQEREVVLERQNKSFGISIVGGKVNVSGDSGGDEKRGEISGIFIKSIIPGSSAEKLGLLKVGDRILGEHRCIWEI